jgi:glucose-6-phosphate 1-dehydrogenase
MTRLPVALILFGATGDLSQRMLIPSLYHLWRDGLLPQDLALVGAARSMLDDDSFRAFAAESLNRFVATEHKDDASVAAFLKVWRYCPVDVNSPESMAALKATLPNLTDGNAVFYLATSPSIYGSIAQGLQQAGMTGGQSRVVIEKPIGKNLQTSIEVNQAVGGIFREEQIYRIDHYLGKETVQNLLVLRFGNMLFEPLWNNQGIEQVQITLSETVGVEGRAAYYDTVGALRDMVQNHVLQLLALVAMEPPSDMNAASVRNEKIKVLRSLRPITPEMISTHTVAGQYTAGAINSAAVKGYLDEDGVVQNSINDSFVALRADIDNWRWSGVPFYIRTGKRMPTRYSEIVIVFKPVPHNIFGRGGGILAPNKLIIRLQPEEVISLMVMAKEPGLARDGMQMREVPLDVSLTTAFAGPTVLEQRRRIAYERLILDVIEGNGTLFVRRDEVEAAWAWIDAIAEGWKRTGHTPKPYTAGSWGPSSAIALPERFGHRWHD